MQNSTAEVEFASWVERYEENQDVATAELLTFVARCCGSSEDITEEMLDDVQTSCNAITSA
jgi:hypothetical protein